MGNPLILPSPRNNQITPQHPLLSPRNLHPLMNHTMIPMPMQKRHPNLRLHSNRLRIPIPPRSLRIKHRLAPLTRSQINKQRPSRATRNRLRLRLSRNRRECYIICLIVYRSVSDFPGLQSSAISIYNAVRRIAQPSIDRYGYWNSDPGVRRPRAGALARRAVRASLRLRSRLRLRRIAS